MEIGSGSDFGSYLPRSLVTRVSGGADPVINPQIASALSIDIAGFTHITEQLVRERAAGVDHLSQILNAFFSDLIVTVEAHGGELVCIQGDGTLAAWCAEEGRLAAAVERAAACGLELSRTLDGYREATGTSLRVRVGLGCGAMLITRLGGPERWLLSVAGEATVEAVAAERQAHPGTFVISSAAWQLLPPKKRGHELRSGFFQLTTLQSALARTPTLAEPAPDEVLLSYLPTAVRARVTSSAPLWQAEVRHITVAFFQLRRVGGPDLEPARAQQAVLILQSELARCGGGMDEITFHDKGSVATAVFGLPPDTYEDNARRAVAAALGIQERAKAEALDVSVGIASGLAFWGPIGRQSRRQFALLGTVMNLGCRLMQRAESEVLCCPRTLQALAGRVSGEQLGEQQLKGFEQPVPVFRATTLRSSQSNRRRLLGRADQCARLLKAIDRARARSGGLIWVESGPGLGKSALLGELEAAAQSAGLPVFRVTGDAIEQSTPYHAWKEPVAELLGLRHRATLAERVASVTARVDALPAMAGLAPLLAPILRLPLGNSPKTSLLDGAARADRTADLMLALLRHANIAGLLIAMEDLHWFDSASLRLALLAHKRLPEVPLIVTTRPVEPPDEAYLALRTAAERIDLQPLPHACVVELVAHRLGGHDVSPEAQAFLRDRAGGNPLFAESLAFELGAAGSFTVVEGVVQIGGDAAGVPDSVPRSLDAVIGTRVDHLSPKDSLTLKTASVLGRTFTLAAMIAVHPGSPSRSDLLASLKSLEDERLIVPIDHASSYIFDHAITHDVTYTRIPRRQREFLHASIAEWYEHTPTEEVPAHYPALAHHREQSGDNRRACHFLELAAEEALHTGAFREGARFLERALSLALRSPVETVTPLRRARWNRQLAEALDRLGDKQRMGDCSRLALRYLGRPEPTSRLGQLLRVLGEISVQALPPALRTLRRRQPVADAAFELSRAHQSLTVHYFYGLRPLGMVANTLQATNAAERTSRQSERAKCYSGMALWLGIVGLQRIATNYAKRAVLACREPDDSAVATQALTLAALYYVGVGDFEETLRCSAAAQALAEPRNDHAWWSTAQAIRIWSHVYRGEVTRMPGLIAELRDRALRADNEQLLAWAIRFEASLQLAAGNAQTAGALFRDVLPIVRRYGDVAEVALVRGSLVLACAREGQIEEARDHLQETMTLISTMGRPTSHILVQGMCDLLDGIAALRGHAPHERLLTACQSRALAALRSCAKSFPIGVPRYHHFLGLVNLQRGRSARARASFKRGLRAAERLALPTDRALLAQDLETLRSAKGAPNALPGGTPSR